MCAQATANLSLVQKDYNSHDAWRPQWRNETGCEIIPFQTQSASQKLLYVVSKDGLLQHITDFRDIITGKLPRLWRPSIQCNSCTIMSHKAQARRARHNSAASHSVHCHQRQAQESPTRTCGRLSDCPCDRTDRACSPGSGSKNESGAPTAPQSSRAQQGPRAEDLLPADVGGLHSDKTVSIISLLPC